MTGLYAWVDGFWLKFSDPYFGPRSTQKSNILGIFFPWFPTNSPKIIQIEDGHVR